MPPYLKYAEFKAFLSVIIGVVAALILLLSGRFMAASVGLISGLTLSYFLARGGKSTYKTNLKGKVCIVTGSNTGIGRATAILLAEMNCHVILACRNTEKAKEAAQEIQKLTGNEHIEAMKLDLSSFASVRAFAKEFLSRNLNCDILINNAGVMMCPLSNTEDGFEMQFGTNHLGHFLLTKLLLPVLIKSKARVVNLSSFGHNFAKPGTSFHEIAHPTEKSYDATVSYGYSKLANILFSAELQRRYGNQGISSFSLHPGGVKTELARWFPSFVANIFSSDANFLFKNPFEGSQTSIYCAIDPNAKPGAYFTDCEAIETSEEGASAKRAQELWEFSEGVVA